MDNERVSVLGIGIMGEGIARTLLAAGYSLTVWNRTPARAEDLADRGATVASTIADAVQSADVIMYCLADDAAVVDVALGPGGILENAAPPQIVVDMSTVHPRTTEREAAEFRSKGVSFVDAPVFGSKAEANGGGLWTVVGSDPTAFETVEPILSTVSESVHYMGPNGSGTAMKLVGNLIVASQLEALGEALVLATKAGLHTRDVLPVLGAADFRSPIIAGVGAALAAQDFSTSFALKHMYKDANLILDFAAQLGSPTPATSAIRETIKAAINQGWGAENASAMVKVLELEAGVRIGEPAPQP